MHSFLWTLNTTLLTWKSWAQQSLHKIRTHTHTHITYSITSIHQVYSKPSCCKCNPLPPHNNTTDPQTGPRGGCWLRHPFTTTSHRPNTHLKVLWIILGMHVTESVQALRINSSLLNYPRIMVDWGFCGSWQPPTKNSHVVRKCTHTCLSKLPGSKQGTFLGCFEKLRIIHGNWAPPLKLFDPKELSLPASQNQGINHSKRDVFQTPGKPPFHSPPRKWLRKAQYDLWLWPMTSYVKHWKEMHPLRRFVNRELHYFICKLAFNMMISIQLVVGFNLFEK